MFNFAKNKLKELVEEISKDSGPSLTKNDNEVPIKYRQEQAVFEGTIKSVGREKAILNDSKGIAFNLLNRGIVDPSSVMSQVDKWKYIREFHPKYYQSVVMQIKRYLENGGAELKKQIPPIPTKQQPQGGTGGAGGGMGADMGMGVAFNKHKMKKEAQMYLYRTDSMPHRLLGTIAADIISGKLQYLDENGNPHAIRTDSKGNVRLKRSSQSIQEAKRINDLMPDKIKEIILAFLKEKHIDHAEKVARASYLRIRNKKNYDLIPVSLALSSSVHVLKMKAINLREPEDVVELRLRIGKACFPMISRLKNALLIDGITFQEIKSYLPSCCANSHPNTNDKHDRVIDKQINHEMHLLGEDSSTSTDIKSLFLTLTHKDSKFKQEAAYRICDLISRYPELVASHEFSESDIISIKNSAPQYAEKVINTLSLINADEADIMKAYFDGDDFDKYIASNFVVSLKKDSVFFAMPEMCLLHGSINIDLFDKLNPKDPTTTKIILKSRAYNLDVPQKMFERKIAEVLCERKDEDLINIGLSESASLASFCLGLLADGDTLKETDFKKYYPNSGKNENVALAAIAIMDRSPDLLKKFNSMFNVVPSSIELVSCKEHATKYMKINRITWDGKAVPNASEMFSLPENPMSLAVSLVNIEDVPAMTALLYSCCKKFSEGDDEVKQTMIFLVRELKRQGHEENAYTVVSNFKIELGPEDDILKDEAATPDRVMFYIQSGNTVAAAHLLNQLFSKDEEAARMTLENVPKPKDPETFLELLPVELVTSVELSDWVRNLRTKSFILPNGLVVTGSNGIYQCLDKGFSCSKKDMIYTAMHLFVGRQAH